MWEYGRKKRATDNLAAQLEMIAEEPPLESPELWGRMKLWRILWLKIFVFREFFIMALT